METIRVLLADDHSLVRQGIAGLLRTQADLEVVGEASNGREAVERARELVPDVILMDISMPVMDGIQATGAIRREVPGAKVLILTVSDDDRDFYDAIKQGARGYLLKNLQASDLFRFIRAVHRGESPLDGSLTTKIWAGLSAKWAEGRPLEPVLTDRETEVLHLVGSGLSNREIAGQLYITENTVKIHLKHILGKLHLQNRVQAAVYAEQRGLLEDGQGRKQ